MPLIYTGSAIVALSLFMLSFAKPDQFYVVSRRFTQIGIDLAISDSDNRPSSVKD
jgi:hypothetical protein